jgi:mannosyltransferase
MSASPFAGYLRRSAGGILLAWALLDAFFGKPQPALAWGPALFRVLLAFHGLVLLFWPRERQAAGPLPARQPVQGKMLLAMLALSVVAVALRIPGLNSCMWLDEILTMVRFARPPAWQILTTFPDQNQHMLYSLMAHGVISVFGEQVWALRLPSVFFGLASIWGLFLLGRKLIGETQALAACALMTVSYHHIWFSENARGYMGLLFFTLLGTWLWLEAMERQTRGAWLAYSVSIALGMWVHMTMLFVTGTHALIFLMLWLRSERRPAHLANAVGAFLLCGTLTLQVYALSLPEFLRTGLSEFSPPSEWTNPLWVVRESLRSLQTGFAAFAVVLCGGVMMAAGWFGMLRRQARAAWAMVLPGAIGGGLMLALGHNLWPRFFFFSMGFALLIAIHGALELPRLLAQLLAAPKPWAERVGYAMAGLMILVSAATVPRCYALPKQDFTGARAYVESNARAGDTVVVAGLAEHAYSLYYAPAWKVVRTPEDLAALRSTAGRTFLVYTLPIELRAAHADLWKTIEADFETDRIFWGTLGGGEVYVLRNRVNANQALGISPR